MNLESNIERIKQLFNKKAASDNDKNSNEKNEKWKNERKLMNQQNRKILYEALTKIIPLIDTIERLSCISYIREDVGDPIMDKLCFQNIQKELLYIKYRITFILKYSQESVPWVSTKEEKDFIAKHKPKKKKSTDNELHFNDAYYPKKEKTNGNILKRKEKRGEIND